MEFDHLEEARLQLRRAKQEGSDLAAKDRHIQYGVLHASLAIAEGQERVAEELKAIREMFGSPAELQETLREFKFGMGLIG